MTREGFAKIINFMTIRSEVLVLVHCHIIHIVKRLNFMKQARGQDGGWRGGVSKFDCMNLMTCINIQHIDCCCIKGDNATFLNCC